METGVRPVMAICPKSAFTAENSEGCVMLKVARYAATFGNEARRYGLPTATSTTGTGPSVSFSMNGARSPASATSPRLAATATSAETTIAEHLLVSPASAFILGRGPGQSHG